MFKNSDSMVLDPPLSQGFFYVLKNNFIKSMHIIEGFIGKRPGSLAISSLSLLTGLDFVMYIACPPWILV